MITNLLVINSSYVGSRDLWWVDDSREGKKGYNIYRAFDYPTNWTKLNAYPWPGHFYRDQSALEEVLYTIEKKDWLAQGTPYIGTNTPNPNQGQGSWVFRIPDFPYSDVVQGRPVLANSPYGANGSLIITVILDGQEFKPARVSGLDKTIWLQMDNTLPLGGAVSAYPLKSDGVVWQADYSGVQKFQVKYKKLHNFVEIYESMVRTFYTVVPIGENGELHKPGEKNTMIVNTMEVDKITWEYQEMVRRNQWIFEEVGEPAYLMFKKTRGKLCGCSETGLGQARSACPVCFGVGIVGGYYGPYDFIYIPPDTALTVELNEGGRKVTRDSRSYLGPTPIVQAGDLIVRRNAERLVINNVLSKNPRGILLQQEYMASLLDEGDTRYLIPINTGLPTIYNPVVRPDPNDGEAGPFVGNKGPSGGPNPTGSGEPIFDPRTVPGKDWENPHIQIGRTPTFGKIQT
jgi:hypothetical protein